MPIFDDVKISAFSQNDVMGPKIGRNKAATEGACHNFSLQWIADIMNHPNGSSKDRMTNLSKKAGGANPVLQKMFVDRWDLEGCEGADTLITQIHGLGTKNIFARKPYIASEILSGLNQSVMHGALYSFWFSVGAEKHAHSVAFYSTLHGGKLTVHFFDPNFGEFLFQSDEFLEFWNALTTKYGPINNHWMRLCTKTVVMKLTGR